MSNSSNHTDNSDNQHKGNTYRQKYQEDINNEKESSQTVDKDPNPGDRNLNPTAIGIFNLITEDFRTYGNSLSELGFWAIAIHRFGNWRMDIKHRWLRMPFSLIYQILHSSMSGLFGINLEYSVKLGRRVRLWHHGGMFLGAVSIGDDVTIRQNTTMGVLQQDKKWDKPIIEDRVDIGVGACILGNITVGHDSIIGSNTVVVRSFPPHSTLFGVPARPVKMKPQNKTTD